MSFAHWLMRYFFTVVVFILGIKAPGIQRADAGRQNLLDSEDSEDSGVNVRRSASDGKIHIYLMIIF